MAVPWVAIVKGVVTGIKTGVNSLLESSAMRKQLRLTEDSARTNARLAVHRANIQRAYNNEELGQQTWNVTDQSEIFVGSQNAAIGGSGFNDVTTGDQVLMKDTVRRTDAAIEGMNRSAYLNSFETDRAAAMEATYYNAQAEIAKRTREILYNKKASFIRAHAQGFHAGGQAFLDSFSLGGLGGGTKDVSPTMGPRPGDFGGGMNKLDLGYKPTNQFASQFVNF